MTPAQTHETRSTASSDWRQKLGMAAVFLGVALAVQWGTGAYRSEFGSEPDEAGHYVTGLMVRDYVAAGFAGNPMHFAQDYYDHYPKVALGHWPPFFYMIQSAWTLVFSPGRVSVLVLMALLTAAVATLVFSFLKAESGGLPAFAGALLFLALPLVQQSAGAVMAEIPTALLVLLAAICFGRFLEREHTADAIWFGVIASLAILTKLSGLALVLVPSLAVVLARKLQLLKRAAFWWPAVIVAILSGPWTLLTLKLASNGLSGDKPGWQFTRQAVPYYAAKLYLAVGAGVLMFAIVGFLVKVFPRGQSNAPSGRWAAMVALWAGVLVMQMLVPAGYEARYLVPALAPVVIFALAGVDWVAGWLMRRGVPARAAWLLAFGVLVGAFALETFRVPVKGYAGFGPVADALLKSPDAAGARILISSDARGEGMFISEMAMHEQRPGHVIRRVSKELATSLWNGNGYQLKFTNGPALLASLRTNSIRYLVLDTSVPPAAIMPHHDLLSRTIEGDSASFILERRFPVERSGRWTTNGILLYRLATN